mmetsp:Transcript_2905/g.6219  ORF Transcript_2905/g.6219 Transcript_2905/m.6219 type:complete len:89 (+) Transcript_2905:392-658(+)|eukprot:CAMPEP_0181180846 /NCGR_PEP_ID=MMETSP1096-20121128/7020_1 /TAXON_ID=156174 ORGANISM="Chrysochromulina ericina, Strain CCMP281" /NCGR_SAMPLE_ID=MMETSP1096 /ASSEMBLY_ACC=CAM_ASM_000453 /LENGTH=88 /DNA_ID=CAMNT_0023269307 /DNA_START=347 /DNA_END=613 /DNA_ORIENTATION=+
MWWCGTDSTWMKAVLPTSICPNVKEYMYWRVKCGKPDDTFFILCDHSTSMDVAIQTLRHVQIGEAILIAISGAELGLYDNAQVLLFNV